ncbi:MAG TPA: hypothetical protein VGO75_09985 [Gemmatimonadaceae bacterium]|nr:hypothetical protein [Gemmatimonadaceae bacterium]
MSRSEKVRRSRFLAVVGMGVVLISNWGCAPLQTAVIVEPGLSFALAPGQSAEIKRSDTRITFRQVREDSRCPTDVTCVWEGDAKVEVVISRTGSPDDTKILSIKAPNNETRVGNLRIRFVGLTPVPRQADAGAPKNYLAEFVAEPG